MSGKHRRRPWILFFPRGLHEQPAWVCIGLLFTIVGIGYVSGTSASPIAMAIGDTGLRVWGGLLIATGAMLCGATIIGTPALEKLALRFMCISLFLYLGYLLTVIPFSRAAGSLLLGGALMLSAAFRIWHLSALMRTAVKVRDKVGDIE